MGLIESLTSAPIQWNAILATEIVKGRIKWDKSTLKALYEKEIEEAKKYNPDLSRFLSCNLKEYNNQKHVARLKRACGVPLEFSAV